MPKFEDYHRTIVGYHGTRQSIAEKVVLGKASLAPSENDDDWLGHGIYFWEYAPKQAWRWAEKRRVKQKWDEPAAVVASMIRLGNCFDLLDPDNIDDLQRMHDDYLSTVTLLGGIPRKNFRTNRFLDCSVFLFAYEQLEEVGVSVDTSRCVYVPTDNKERIWKGSWISRGAHIQVCVRNPACILGTWLVQSSQEQETIHETEV